MDQVTHLVQAGVAKVIVLIVGAGVCMLAGALVSYLLAKRNPRWSRATKNLVHSVSIFGAAVVFAVFAVVWIRVG